MKDKIKLTNQEIADILNAVEERRDHIKDDLDDKVFQKEDNRLELLYEKLEKYQVSK